MGQGAGKSSEAAAQPPGVFAPVFISYASQDTDAANQICNSLEAQGITCWIAPRDVKPGAQYADAIVHAINDAKAVVLVMSASAVASAHVGKEIERGSSKRKPIIAFRIDAAPLNHALEYFLSESQWIDVPALGMQAALTKLPEAVGHVSTAPARVMPANRPVGLSKRIAITAGIVIALGVAIASGMHFWSSNHSGMQLPPVAPNASATPGVAISEKSVAVLPFVDMSEKKDQEYFSDGLSEELIDMLTKVADLRVPARTSSFYFKGKSEDIPTIAKRLLVAHVLEGSVRKSGNHMRITVQLVRADNGYHVWSQTYDRQVDDIFKVQDEIAGAVVKALRLSLFAADVPLAAQTSNTDAYLLYLKGTALFRRGNAEDNVASVATLRQSLELDPRYALGWGMLTRALRVELINGHGAYATVSADIRAAATRAVSLDPKLPDAFVALASRYLVDWQWDKADEALKKALALDPGNPLALLFASFLALDRGQIDQARQLAEAALVRDPLNFFIFENLVNINMVGDRYAEAEAYLRKSLELNPAQGGIRGRLALFKDRQGDLAGALLENDKEPDEENRLFTRMYLLERNGRRPETDMDFAVYLKKYAASNPFSTASAYARRADVDRAFEWLDRAYQQHDDSLTGLKVSYGFRNLHGDPRYKAMLRKMNLPE